MYHFFTTLRFRLILLVFLALLPALGLILYSGLEQRRFAAAEARKEVSAMVHHASAYQERVVEGVRQMLAVLAELPAVRQQNSAACIALFARILESQKILGNISAADRQGKVFASGLPQPGFPPSSAGRSHFERALQTKKFSIGEYGIGRASGKPTIHFGYPIINNGEVIGVVSTSVILDYLSSLVAKTPMAPDAMITVIDREGTVLARHPQPEQWVGKRLPETEIIKIAVARGEGTTEATGIDGVLCVFAFAPLGVGNNDLFVYAGEPIKTVYAEANRILIRNLLALGGVAFLALLMSWILGQVFLVKRTHTLVDKAQQMAGGDLTVRSNLSYQDGEFGQLAKSFDEMAATLEQRQQNLKESEEKYRTLVENISLGITLIGSDHKIIMTNAGMGRLFHKLPEQFVGKHCFQEFEKREAICPHCPGAKTLATGQPAEVDTAGTRDDGTSFSVHIRTFPTFDFQGNTTGFIEVVEDTTARRLVEEQLAWESRVTSAVSELSRALLSSRSIEEISQMVLDNAVALTESSLGYCGYIDPRTGYFIVPTLSRNVWEACQVPGKDIIFKEFTGLWGHGLEQRQPVLSNNPATDPRSVGTPPGHIPIQRFLSVPAMTGENLFGQVAVGNASRNYSDRDQKVCEHLALIYALAIQRQRAEETVRKSEERYRLLAENVRDVIWTLDLKGHLTYASPSARLLTGFTPEETMGMALDQLLTPQSLETINNLTAGILDSEKRDGAKYPRSETVELEYLCKDGSTVWAEVKAAAWRDAQGQLTGFQGVSRDITNRKQMIEAVQESEKRFRDITENAAFWVWETDSEGKYTFASPVVEKLLGYKPEEVLGRYYYDLVVTEDREEVKEMACAAFTAKQSFRDFPNRNLHKNGAIVWLSTSGVPLLDVQGNLLGYRGCDIDITEQLTSRAALEDANVKLKALVQNAEERNRHMASFNEMSEALQSCLTSEEAFATIDHFILKFFPSDAGALYLFRNSKNLLTPVMTWGQSPPVEELFSPQDCWAVRSGRPHLVTSLNSGLPCRHVPSALTTGYLCVPLVAQGESLGILHIRLFSCTITEGEGEIETKQRLAVAVAENLSLALANLKLRETLQNQAIRDPLTGLYNRRYLEETMERELHRARRQETHMGVVMMDLDHFKTFNDTFGHAAGDVLLSAVSNVIKNGVREEDIACRYGGEEFLLLMPGASLNIARERAETLRRAVKNLQVKYDGRFLKATSISMGVALFPVHGSTANDLIAAADAALYQAKQAGRDRVELAGEIPLETATPPEGQ